MRRWAWRWRWYWQSVLLVMLASLLALPAIRSRVGNIAVTSTGVFLGRRTVLEDRGASVNHHHHTYSEAARTTTTTTTTTARSQSTFSAITASGSPSNPAESFTPPVHQNLQNQRVVQHQLAAMSSSQGAPLPPVPVEHGGCAKSEGSEAKGSKDGPAEPELPKLSASEFREYNQLADMMNAYVCFPPLPPPSSPHPPC